MKFECCSKFRSKTGHAKHNLKVHKIVVNTFRADYVCFKCNRKGDSEESINNHLKSCTVTKPTRYMKLRKIIDNNYVYNNRV